MAASSCARVMHRVSPRLGELPLRVGEIFFRLLGRVDGLAHGCAACRSRLRGEISASARSKSSPPSAESPPVAFTWKTPSWSWRMEMSKVPPPRS